VQTPVVATAERVDHPRGRRTVKTARPASDSRAVAIPDFQTLMLPFLRLVADEREHVLGELIDGLAAEFQLTSAEREELLPSGRQQRFDNRVGWTATYLKKAGLIDGLGGGRYRLTERGRSLLAENPRTLSVSMLEARFRELAEFVQPATRDESEEAHGTFNVSEGIWDLRPVVRDRIQKKMERSLPDEKTRRGALELLAFAVENADEERGDAWCIRETVHGLVLAAGRQRACKVARARVQIAVIGPVREDVRAALGAEADDDQELKKVPGGAWLTFPAENAGKALELLRDSINAFIDLAMARTRGAVSLESHVPEAVSYLSGVVGRFGICSIRSSSAFRSARWFSGTRRPSVTPVASGPTGPGCGRPCW
jgi:hypothetical protein